MFGGAAGSTLPVPESQHALRQKPPKAGCGSSMAVDDALCIFIADGYAMERA